ncbi:MAG TPA: glutamate-cysteine ligase family protein [Candidatus Saccharimonadales bacterium]|nr:glutamate-cysteine ligase family protein [Candidatus Saccharimonadales bacterium]
MPLPSGEVNLPATGQLTPTPTYGLELEKVFTRKDGPAHLVDDSYFTRLRQRYLDRHWEAEVSDADERLVGVVTPHGVESLDNSFGLGESATGPIRHESGGLNELDRIVAQQVQDVVEVLDESGATILNMSNHPLTNIDDETYERHVVPKPVYEYMRTVRGWDHKSGINAKAQNSPSVGVPAEQAVEALNITLGLGAALVALYANSPFEEGNLAGAKESRLHIWDKVFKNPTFSGDHRLHQMPGRPFENMRDYFQWMFGPDTAMYFIVVDDDGHPPKSEKSGHAHFIQVDEHPTVLEFLQKPNWQATAFEDNRRLTVTSHMSHFAMHQFTQFAGARIRYGLRDGDFPTTEFNEAMSGTGNEVDNLFAEKGAYFYIEGREPGANFPDQELFETAGETVARSVIMSAAALHAGLIRNGEAAKRLIDSYGWPTLQGLRESAIKAGLEGMYNDVSMPRLCSDVLSVAADGLDSDEQWMLAYPEYVIRTGQTGADRALARYEQLSGSTYSRIAQIVREKGIVLN